MALLAIVMCVNFASCSSDNDEESNGGKSTQELLQGVWYDAYTDDCPYFIVEKGYCYFANQPSTVYYVEKYKYTFDSKNNTRIKVVCRSGCECSEVRNRYVGDGQHCECRCKGICCKQGLS